MGLAKHKKLSKSEYDSLSVKDEDILYAVNQNGDFSEENLEDSAELYIGDKKITPTIVGSTGQSTTSVMHQKAVTDAINGLQSEIESKSEGFYGECNISPSTVAKTVTTLNGGFVLKKGAKVSVKFLQGHTASTMTLNVDGTGAKNVYRDGLNPTSTMIKSYNVYDFVYDGTYWIIVGVDTDTTYSNATQLANGLMSSADKKKLDSLGKSLTVNNVVYNGTSEKTVEASYLTPKYKTSSDSSVTYRKLLSITPTSSQYGDSHVEFTIMGRDNVKCEISIFIRTHANKKYISKVSVNSFGTLGMVTAYKYTNNTTETDIVEIWLKIPSYDTVKIFPKTYYSYTYLTIDWDSATSYSSLPTDYTSKIDVFEGFRTYGLEVMGGIIKLANFAKAKIHGFLNSVANGNYSSAMGYNSFAGIRTSDTAYPYAYIVSVSPLQFTIVDDTLYGVSLAKGDSTTYAYNGNDYTVTNPSGSYAASVFLVQDSDGLLAKGTSYPMNICIIAKNAVTVGTGRILSAKNITGDVWEIIVNQQDNTINSYTSPLILYLQKKTSSTSYSGDYSVASGVYSVASGYHSVASGSYSVASGYYSVASGSYSVASGSSSVASGSYSVASGSSSVASGYSSVASGSSSVASGYYSVASGVYSVASGYHSVASGSYSVASGSYSVASGYYSVALNARTNAKGTYQTVVGVYNADDNNAYFIVGNGSSDTARSNAMTVSKTGVVTANTFKGALQGNADSATKVNNALTINHNGTTKTYDGSSAVTIDIASGGSSSGESSIQPFAGFMTGEDMSNIVDQSSILTGGQVYCSQSKNRFYYKVNGLFYGGFPNASLYNDNYDHSSDTAKTGAIFSYNGKHYTMYNGTLQDMSVLDDNGNMTTAGIVKLSDEYSGSALNYGVDSGIASTPKAVSTAFSTMKTYVDNKATQSNQYTDTQIDAKIQLVTALPAEPTSGVLYLIAES